MLKTFSSWASKVAGKTATAKTTIRPLRVEFTQYAKFRGFAIMSEITYSKQKPN